MVCFAVNRDPNLLQLSEVAEMGNVLIQVERGEKLVLSR
jgi:hypothetical protein